MLQPNLNFIRNLEGDGGGSHDSQSINRVDELIQYGQGLIFASFRRV